MIINKQKNSKRIIKIIIPVILIILFILIIANNIKRTEKRQQFEQVNNYTSIEQFKTIEEVAIFMECDYIKEETSKTQGYTKDIYLKIKIPPIENKNSNQRYYEKLFTYCAKVVDYDNFIIIDKSQNLIISIICNKKDKTINQYYINEQENYFQAQTSKISIEEYVPIESTKIEIQSQQLKQIINSNWETADTLGTKESIYKKYDIYFDEGISIRKVNGKIFNIVFNTKYEQPVVNNINTNMTLEQIEQILGTPQYKNELSKVIGYKSEQIYVFFSEGEISVYNAQQQYETMQFAKLVAEYNQNKDLVKFISNLKNIWTDYDEYKYDSNYVYIQYSLKGVVIKMNYKNNNGIFIYNNFTGNILPTVTLEQLVNNEKEIPENICIENKNLVLDSELSRISNSKQINTDYLNIIKNGSNEFTIDITNVNSSIYMIGFISKTKEYPNRELNQYINYGIWLDNENFVFSVSNKGIYKYNVKTNKYTTIKTGKQEYKIISLQNNILKYDDTSVEL